MGFITAIIYIIVSAILLILMFKTCELWISCLVALIWLESKISIYSSTSLSIFNEQMRRYMNNNKNK
jgi:uncharacterized protein YqfA (UPF0365 family)